MALRDIPVLIICYGLLVFVPFRPFLGLLLYSWLAYMRPQDLAWGLGTTHLSDWVAIAMILGLVFALRRERVLTLRPQLALMITLLLWVGVTVYTAVLYEPSLERFELFAKVVLIPVLTTGLVRSEKRFKYLMWTVAFSLGLLGFKTGLFGLLRGGAAILQGPGGFMVDNNGYAFALVVALPLLVGIALAERATWMRILAAVFAMFTAFSVVFTFSRGGLVALSVVSVLLLFGSKRPFLAGIVVLASAGILFASMSADFEEAYRSRAETLQNVEEDGSAMGRVAAWKTAIEMAKEYPVFGVGPANFQYVYRRFGNPDEARVAHNVYFQWLTDSGVPALVLFLLMLAVTVWRMWKLGRNTKHAWAATYARMITISIVGFAVGATFLDKAYYDLIYHVVGISVSLELAAETALSPAQVPAPALSPAPWWTQTERRFV